MNKSTYVLSYILLFNISILFAQSTNEMFNLGKIAYEKSDFVDAAEKFNNSIESTTVDLVLAEQYFWYAKALFHISGNNISKSLELLSLSISKDSEYTEAYFLRARINFFTNSPNQIVIDDYAKAYANARKSYKKDIFIKGISLANIKSKNVASEFTSETIESADVHQYIDLISECYYTNAAISSLDGNNKQSLFWLKMALENGFKPSEFMFFDFLELIDSQDFLNLMQKYNLPPEIYQTINKNELKRVVSIGEKGFKRSDEITRYVERKINNWQKKGKFEKTIDYQKRVNEVARSQKISYYTQKAIDSIGYSKINWANVSNEYDADNESFKITFKGFDPLFVGVPLSDAPSFDLNFDSLEFTQFKFVLLDDYTTEIAHIEISNSVIGKTYIYNNTDNVLFNSTEFAFNFDKIEVPIEGLAKTTSSMNNSNNTKVISIGESDVDTNIPITANNNEYTYALIIGNEDYTKYQTSLSSESNVDFAIRDAEVFAKYAEKTLGIPKENITVLKDAISSQMQREIEKISKITKYHNGEGNIIFYYAGHGFPDEVSKESYLMPVDVGGSDVKYGIKLSDLYQELTMYPSQKVLVILDACFSGGGRNQGLLAARGVKIKPKENVVSGNLVVFSSSTGEQSSLPYKNKQHGMFTYFLLKKLKESKGDINLEELSDYVTKEVQISALKINSKEQNPKILVSPDVGNLWMDWKLN